MLSEKQTIEARKAKALDDYHEAHDKLIEKLKARLKKIEEESC